MPQSSFDPLERDPDDAQDSVSLGAVAPGEPNARAPVEIESLQLKPKPSQNNWAGPERRRSAGEQGGRGHHAALAGETALVEVHDLVAVGGA